MQRNVSDVTIITIPVSADSKRASASSVRNRAIFLRSVQLEKTPDKPAFFVDRGDGNTSDSEDSISSIFCTNETDSSNKKFTVKITKMTVNRVISEEQYPLPNTDDMFACLAGGQKFTKLDLSQAYSQLE